MDNELIGDLVAYTMNQEGKGFPRKLGVAFKNNKGQIKLLFNSFPVGPNWDGAVYIFPKKEEAKKEIVEEPKKARVTSLKDKPF